MKLFIVVGMYLSRWINGAFDDSRFEEVRIEVMQLVSKISGNAAGARIHLPLHSLGESIGGDRGFFLRISESLVDALLDDLGEIL